MSTIARIFGNRAMTLWRGLVRQIEQCGAGLGDLDSDQLRKKSLGLRYQALAGATLDSLLPEAFALVREASRRELGMTHFDVQLLGAIAMHFRGVAVMQTGEGKTLTATLPLFLASLKGRGSHLATANDYLASRDAESMRPLFQALACSVGSVVSQSTRAERRRAYHSDVTYTTAKEIGFDFLRDRLLIHRQESGIVDDRSELMAYEFGGDGDICDDLGKVQRELYFCCVDEADNILIDEARTPLIVSGSGPQSPSPRSELYRWAAEVAPRFVQDSHFTRDPSSRQIRLSQTGRELVRKLGSTDILGQFSQVEIYEQIELALVVDRDYIKDRHYVVRDGAVVIVDEFTGRLAEGRKWRAGLHQAIEAREKLDVTVETDEAARITIQALFSKYERLAGMTGTVANSAPELEKIFCVKVHEIPTNRPPRREALPDAVFATESQKWAAIRDEVARLHKSGRPVLIGTRSIDKSDLLSKLLDDIDIQHSVLNAREVAREAEIVAKAGGLGRVTVATNLAGRGTDIQLDPAVRQLGGLHVICSELHESARIDRQLIGRCGRQGDPGSFRQYMSLEDDILKNGVSPRTIQRLRRYRALGPKDLARFAQLFRKAQRRIEARHFAARKLLMFHERQRHEIQREMGLDPYLDAPAA